YSIEDEIRLLIVDDGSIPSMANDWIMTHSHSIINPIIEFQLNSKVFPLHLREVILGPKRPEREANKVQMEELIRRKQYEISSKLMDSDLRQVKVGLSQIEHYR